MTCHYCRAQNGADEHRCCRCGRRLSDEPVRFPVQMGAAAPALQSEKKPAESAAPPVVGPRLAPVPSLPPQPDGQREPVQPSLFGPMVVSRDGRRPVSRTGQAKSRRLPGTSQQQFEFGEASRALPRKSAAVYGNTPVAPAGQRVAAAAVDALIPLSGFAIFLAVISYMAGPIVLNSATMPVMAAAGLLITLFYRLVYCLGRMDTPGVQWAGLRLVDFDGRRPSRKARAYRLAGGLISGISAGMGLLWSLADEERLTWHDHMSHTFPTPRVVREG